MDYTYSTYSSSIMQQQYQPNIQPIMQQSQNLPAATDVQAFSYVPDQPQLHQTEPNLLMLNRVTPENQATELQPINNIGKYYIVCALIMHFKNN